MRCRLPAFVAAVLGILLLISLAGCNNPWIQDLLKPWQRKTVSFDSSGGSTVAEQDVENGKTASKPTDPTKTMDAEAGLYLGTPDGFVYTFIDWFLDGSPYDFNTPVTEDITLVAQWGESENTPSLIPYDVVPANNVNTAVGYVNSNAAVYTLLIDQNVNAGTQLLNVAGVNLTIIGIDAERTIQYDGDYDNALFNIVNPSASLTLGNNITLRGIAITAMSPLVRVANEVSPGTQTGGTLTMKAGSKITGQSDGFSNGTVIVSGPNSRFFMEGGQITGNSTALGLGATSGLGVQDGATINISGGTISGNFVGDGSDPGDVVIFGIATFTLSGNAQIGDITLIADVSTSTSTPITLSGNTNASPTVINLSGRNGNSSINPTITAQYWSGTYSGQAVAPPILTGDGLNAAIITRFTLGQFYAWNLTNSRPITGNAPDSGNGNYYIGTLGADLGKLTRVFTRGELLSSVGDIIPYLASQGGGATADNPVPLNMGAVLGSMQNSSANDTWQQLMNDIGASDKFVDLDLSACSITGASFSPGSNDLTGKDKIVSIALPDAATNITAGGSSGMGAFRNFTVLKSISGKGLTTIYAYAFQNCTSLTSLPEGLTTIGNQAFSDCTGLKLTSLPEKLTEIGAQAFWGCTGLTQMTLHNAIAKIGINAFANCTNLVSVTFLCDISGDDFGASAFPGDLRGKYLDADGGKGTYTRPTPGNTGTWTKEP